MLKILIVWTWIYKKLRLQWNYSQYNKAVRRSDDAAIAKLCSRVLPTWTETGRQMLRSIIQLCVVSVGSNFICIHGGSYDLVSISNVDLRLLADRARAFQFLMRKRRARTFSLVFQTFATHYTLRPRRECIFYKVQKIYCLVVLC